MVLPESEPASPELNAVTVTVLGEAGTSVFVHNVDAVTMEPLIYSRRSDVTLEGTPRASPETVRADVGGNLLTIEVGENDDTEGTRSGTEDAATKDRLGAGEAEYSTQTK